MNKIWHRLKFEIKQRLILGYWLLMVLWFIIPLIIATFVGMRFMVVSFYNTNPASNEILKILISAIGLAATLSGLAYRASSGCENENTKKNLYFAGNLLFFSTIMFIFTLLVNYSLEELTRINLPFILKSITQVLISIIKYFLFFYGMIDGLIGISILRTALDWNVKKKIKARWETINNRKNKGAGI